MNAGVVTETLSRLFADNQIKQRNVAISVSGQSVIIRKITVPIMTPAELAFDYRNRFGEATAPAYERLLLAALEGDPTLFLRADEVEAAWRFTDAVRAGWSGPGAPPLLEYAAGGWGPPAAEGLFHGCEGGWSRG